eukprot:101772-Alexandrium_andersonii.AAC.1
MQGQRPTSVAVTRRGACRGLCSCQCWRHSGGTGAPRYSTCARSCATRRNGSTRRALPLRPVPWPSTG